MATKFTKKERAAFRVADKKLQKKLEHLRKRKALLAKIALNQASVVHHPVNQEMGPEEVATRQKRRQATVESSDDEEDDENPRRKHPKHDHVVLTDDEEEGDDDTEPPPSRQQKRNRKSHEHKKKKAKGERIRKEAHKAKEREDRHTLRQINDKILALQEQAKQLKKKKPRAAHDPSDSSSSSDSDDSDSSTFESFDSSDSSDDDDSDSDSTVASTRRRSRHGGGSIKGREPPVYNGSGRTDLEYWKRRCEYNFKGRRSLYREDSKKILFACPYLSDDLENLWQIERKQLRREGKPKPTWRKFIKFLIGLLGTKEVQQAKDEQEYKDLGQHTWDISPSKLALDMARLEGRLHPKDERQKVVELMTRLLKPIRDEVLSVHGYPKHRSALISKAEATWEKLRPSLAEPMKTQKIEKPPSSAKPTTNEGGNRGLQKDANGIIYVGNRIPLPADKQKLKDERVAAGLCWPCGSSEHTRDECPVRQQKIKDWEIRQQKIKDWENRDRKSAEDTDDSSTTSHE